MTDIVNDVEHRANESRFVIALDGQLAHADYTVTPGVITFTHTIVPQALQGQGLGTRLVIAGLDYARSQGLRVIPRCAMFAGYMRKHPESQELLAPEGRPFID